MRNYCYPGRQALSEQPLRKINHMAHLLGKATAVCLSDYSSLHDIYRKNKCQCKYEATKLKMPSCAKIEYAPILYAKIEYAEVSFVDENNAMKPHQNHHMHHVRCCHLCCCRCRIFDLNPL